MYHCTHQGLLQTLDEYIQSTSYIAESAEHSNIIDRVHFICCHSGLNPWYQFVFIVVGLYLPQ